MDAYTQKADKTVVEKTITALKKGQIEAIFVETGEEAKKKVLEMIPQGAEVMTMSSVTLDTFGINKEIDSSGKYISIRTKLVSMDRTKDKRQMKILADNAEWVVGSVQAVTEDGKILSASNTGSQLPAYIYGADHVIWVVGTQKIVKDLDEGMRRLYDYVLPLESVRLNKAYNLTTGSHVSKLLIMDKEIVPGRVTVIFVNEVAGF